MGWRIACADAALPSIPMSRLLVTCGRITYIDVLRPRDSEKKSQWIRAMDKTPLEEAEDSQRTAQTALKMGQDRT